MKAESGCNWVDNHLVADGADEAPETINNRQPHESC